MADLDARDARARIAGAAVTALARVGDDLVARSQALAPKDEGTLRASAALVLIVAGNRYEGAGALPAAKAAAEAAARAGQAVSIDAEVSYNTVYAARQHEETTWAHAEGEAKYLQRPLMEQADRYGRIVRLAAAASL